MTNIKEFLQGRIKSHIFECLAIMLIHFKIKLGNKAPNICKMDLIYHFQ